jgi:hypothetical protein
MEAKKQLRKPENWEDFESLCKKLWGEVWDCKEIKKNGRKGQSQNGVDVYGIPKGENSYFGIQCKGKDEYSHKQLSEKEIDREINLAKAFNPPLAKLYIATTANKDANIEEYIRIKDLEHRQKGLFEVHLFSWEDIVDLIDENKVTHDWYLNLHKFKGIPDVLVCFENDKDELTGSVPFCEQRTYFVMGEKPSSMFDYTPYKISLNVGSPLFKGENKSYFRFKLKIKNIGAIPVVNPKLMVQLSGNYETFDDENADSLLVHPNIDVEVNQEKGSLSVTPRRTTLALEEEYISSIICVKPQLEGCEINLTWKLISNNLKKEGLLKIKIDTYLIQKDVVEYVEFKLLEKVEVSIEDYFEEDEE